MTSLLDHRGFSVMEVMIGAAITTVAILGMSRYGAMPTQMANSLMLSTYRQTPVKALDPLVDDLKQADSSSFPMASIVVANGGPLDWFKVYNLQGSPPLRYVNYRFEPGVSNVLLGNLLRCVNNIAPRLTDAQCQTILNNVIAPDASTPLFRQDVAYPNLLIVSLWYQPGSALDRVKAVRRVSLRT